MSRMQEAVAERLRMTRARLDLSLVEAAEKTGVARHTIAALERGKRAPYFPTVEKLARGYGVPAEWILGIDVEEGSGESPGLRHESREPASLAKSEAPPSAESDERSLSYVDAWATFVDELAGDIEEWKYEETSKVTDPADLPEDAFLLFIRAAMPRVQTYQRVHEIVYADEVGLLPLLQDEVRSRGRKDREIERFERAFRRLSRVILAVVTERVAQRVAQLAAAEEQATAQQEGPFFASVSVREKVPENVVDMCSWVRKRPKREIVDIGIAALGGGGR